MKCTLSGGGLVAKWCPTLAIPWTVAGQAPLSLGFSRQEYWSGLPFPSPGDLPDPGITPRSPAWQADSFPSELQGSPCFILVHRNYFYLCQCKTVPVRPLDFISNLGRSSQLQI